MTSTPFWQTPVFAITLLVVMAAIVVGLIFWRRKQAKQAKSGGSSKARAVSRAKSWARGNSFRVIAPADLARKGKTAHLDAVVIGYFGVLGVKAMGYNGEIYGTAEDDTWLQVAPDGTRVRFKNPVDEASADVRVIRDALFEAKLKMIAVEVAPVFTDKKAQIAVPKSAGTYTMKTFRELLNKEKYREDKGLDLDRVEAAIRAALADA